MKRGAPFKLRNTLENRLWVKLKAMEGFRFRRNSPFRTFVLDFVEHELGLVISLEHGEPGRRSNNVVRDRLLSEQGYVILRLPAREAERDLHSALRHIRAVLEDLAIANSA